MSLIEAMMVKCVIMNKITVSDGQGGTITTWSEGAEISCAITNDTSIRSQVADATRNTATYTIVTKKATALDFYDVVKRIADGQTFRITSGKTDGAFPAVASDMLNDYSKYTAEKWELTS